MPGNGQTEFAAWLDQLRRNAASRRWRYLVLLSGERSWARTLCAACPVLVGPAAVWCSDEVPAGARALVAAQASQLLGTESASVVYDAWAGLHPNALAVLAGTIRAGGVLVLLTPDLDAWPRFNDPDYVRMDVPGFPVGPERRFLRYLARQLGGDQRVMRVVPAQPLPLLPEGVGSDLSVPLEGIHGDCLTDEQAQAVAAMEHVVDGHRNRPLVLCSDRGRGKTAALGIACARLLRRGISPILVTAPALRNVGPLFERAAALLPGAQRVDSQLSWQDGCIRFCAPDYLLAHRPAARLLMVDEAAALPAPMLSAILDHYHRLVFTTTVHGYEGSGRGFALRFQPELSRRMPHWRYMTLFAPVRWGADDPLEASLNRLLLLQADAPLDQQLQPTDAQRQRLEILDRNRLVSDPALLQQIFGLLMMAHYRTTPDDLRLLLDGPNMRLAVMFENELVAAVVLFACEGELERSLSVAVREGRRRPRGHLLPQVVLAQTGCADLIGLAGWRIVRIAVHPALQRQGRGRLMLDWLAERAAVQGVSYLGSSFGATGGLIGFWLRAGFDCVTIGTRRDAASGAHALVVLRPLSAEARLIVRRERKRFARTFPLSLGESLRELEAEVVLALLRALPRTYPIGARDAADVRAFAAGARTYQSCYPALWRAALVLLGLSDLKLHLDAAQIQLLVSKLLQHQDWAVVTDLTGYQGRKRQTEVLRHIFAEHLSPLRV